MRMVSVDRSRSPIRRPAKAAAVGLLLAGLAAVVACRLSAQPAGPSSLPDRINALIERHIKTYNVPGLAVRVIQHGQVVFSKNYGWTDLENRVPVADDTLFRIGSITKPLTATAALALAQRGQLDLDAPVERYCPAFGEKPWPPTTRQLLAPLGGIRSFRTEGGVS